MWLVKFQNGPHFQRHSWMPVPEIQQFACEAEALGMSDLKNTKSHSYFHYTLSHAIRIVQLGGWLVVSQQCKIVIITKGTIQCQSIFISWLFNSIDPV